jgi:hypothetical protein
MRVISEKVFIWLHITTLLLTFGLSAGPLNITVTEENLPSTRIAIEILEVPTSLLSDNEIPKIILHLKAGLFKDNAHVLSLNIPPSLIHSLLPPLGEIILRC